MHAEYILFNIIDLYLAITFEESIDIDKLLKASSVMEALINKYEGTIFNFDFPSCLENLLDKYPDYICKNDNKIVILNTMDEFYEVLATDLPEEDLDYILEESVNSIYIYEALDLAIPYEETKDFFNLNNKIMQNYTLLAKCEYLHDKTNTTPIINKLIEQINELKTKVKNADNHLLLQIKMVCAKYNLCLEEDVSYFENNGWYISLFSDNPTTMQKLRYERLEYLLSEEEYEAYTDDIPTINISEISIFLFYFMNKLNNFLKNNLPNNIREPLIIKKYLLLSMPELELLEHYYLKYHTIDNFNAISYPLLSDSSFEILSNIALSLSESFTYTNADLTNNPYLYASLIIKSLFIKTFLELNKNEQYDHDIRFLLLENNQNENFSKTTNLIKELILNDGYNRMR